MVVGDEDAFEILELEACPDDLPRHAVSAVDNVKRASRHDHAGRRSTRNLWAGTSRCSKKNHPRSALLRFGGFATPQRRKNDSGAQHMSPTEGHFASSPN